MVVTHTQKSRLAVSMQMPGIIPVMSEGELCVSLLLWVLSNTQCLTRSIY